MSTELVAAVAVGSRLGPVNNFISCKTIDEMLVNRRFAQIQQFKRFRRVTNKSWICQRSRLDQRKARVVYSPHIVVLVLVDW